MLNNRNLMNTDPNDAFLSLPPDVRVNGEVRKLRPFAPNLWKKLAKAESLMGEDYTADTALAVAFIVTHSIPVEDTIRLLDDESAYRQALLVAAVTVDAKDAQAVGDYLGRLIDRFAASQLEVPEKPAVV